MNAQQQQQQPPAELGAAIAIAPSLRRHRTDSDPTSVLRGAVGVDSSNNTVVTSATTGTPPPIARVGIDNHNNNNITLDTNESFLGKVEASEASVGNLMPLPDDADLPSRLQALPLVGGEGRVSPSPEEEEAGKTGAEEAEAQPHAFVSAVPSAALVLGQLPHTVGTARLTHVRSIERKFYLYFVIIFNF